MTSLTVLDGSIVGLYLLVTMIAGLAVRKYVGKVEHFLVAGREMNVYLGIASLAATEFGIVTCMYTAQNGFENGFAGAMPGHPARPSPCSWSGCTGFCIKPLRDAGVMTIPELFEKRFGPRVRWAAGVVIVLGGLLNMGVFLRTGGEFLRAGAAPVSTAQATCEITMTVLLVRCRGLHDPRRHALGAGHRLPAVRRHERRADRRHRPHPGQGRLGHAGGHRARRTTAPAVSIRSSTRRWAGRTSCSTPCCNMAAVLTWQTTIARVLAGKDTETGRKIYTRTSFFFVCRFLIPGIWGIAALAALEPAQVRQRQHAGHADDSSARSCPSG